MRVVVFGPHRRVGVWEGDQVIDVNYACAKYLRETRDDPRPYQMAEALVPSQLGAFIDGGLRTLDYARQATEYLLRTAGERSGIQGETLIHPGDQVKLHAPLPSPASRIACAGANYISHVAGMGAAKGEERSYEELYEQARAHGKAHGLRGFWKVAHLIAGPGESVIYPARARLFDYEGEVAVVLGKPAKDVPAGRADDYIWGVTIHIDWSIREDPFDNGVRSFRGAKNFDTSSSLGPSIVVGELDPQNVDIETRVDGELRQRYNSRDMVFSFAEFIEFLSRDMTLMPGDIISGGTGAGTAMDSSRAADGGISTERFLRPGNVVEVSSPRIGTLSNRIVAKAAEKLGR